MNIWNMCIYAAQPSHYVHTRQSEPQFPMPMQRRYDRLLLPENTCQILVPQHQTPSARHASKDIILAQKKWER